MRHNGILLYQCNNIIQQAGRLVNCHILLLRKYFMYDIIIDNKCKLIKRGLKMKERENKKEQSISLIYVINILKKGWKLIVVLFLLGAVAAYAISSYLITPEYSSYVSLYVTNNTTMSGGNINSSDISASQQLADTYIVILNDNTVKEQVCNKLHTKLSVGQLNGIVSFTAINDTEVIKIVAVSSDPELSAEICNVYGSIAPEVLQRVIKAGSVEIIGKAKVSAAPVSPNISRNTMIGAAVGIVAAIGVLFLKTVFDNTVQNEEELKGIVDVPVWASIPSFTKHNDKRHKGEDQVALRRMIINSKTPFAITEAYKNARTSMSFSITDTEAKAVVVTSCEPDAGKSTTVANLAMTMAKTNAKVLIVDADLRKPIQHKYFKVDNSRGLSGVLAGHYSIGSCISEVAKNLYLMPSGVIPPNPSELISSDNMSKLIKELKNVYDYIFFDAPPASVVTDATVLAPKLDGVIFIVRQNRSEYPEMTKVMDDITRFDGKILGIILTDVTDYNSFGITKYRAYDYRYGGVAHKPKSETDKEAKEVKAEKSEKDKSAAKSDK